MADFKDLPESLQTAAMLGGWGKAASDIFGGASSLLNLASTGFQLYDTFGPKRRHDKKMRKLQKRYMEAQVALVNAETAVFVAQTTTLQRVSTALEESYNEQRIVLHTVTP